MKTAAITAVSLVALATLAATSPAAAQQVEIRDAVARVVVIVEDRADIGVEIQPGSAPIPALQVRRTGGKVVITGDLRHSLRNCRVGNANARQPGEGASVEVRRVGRVNLTDAPLILIRSPRAVDVGGGGAVFGAVGRGATSVELGSQGCGDWTVANTDGKMELSVAGSGSIRAGTSRDLEANVGGSGSIVTGATGRLEANVGGSGDITVARTTGAADLAIGGSGNITVRGGSTPSLSVAIGGSGDVDFAGTAGDADISIAGSGDVRVARATGQISRAVVGSGDIVIGR